MTNNELCKCGKVGEISCPHDERCGSNNKQLPADVEKEIIDKSNARLEKMKEFAENEWDLKYAEGFGEGWQDAATEYATTAYQAQQEKDRVLKSAVRYALDKNELENKLVALQAKCARYEKALNEIATPDHYTPDTWEDLGEKMIKISNEALSGEGERICPNCNKVFNADRHGCCRECGSDEYQNQKEDKQ